MTADRRLTLLIAASLLVHLVALAWFYRPVAVPLSLPTMEVLLVSPRQAPSSAPVITDPTERTGASETRPAESDPAAAATNQAAPTQAATDRRLSRQGPTRETVRPATEASPLPIPIVDRSRALEPLTPSKPFSTPGSAASTREAQNAGVILAIRQQLARYQAYPASARRRGLEGAATVRFVITRSGRLVDSELMESSGSRHLDQAALKLVSDAAPYPPLPAAVSAARLEVKIPIEYRLAPPAT
ncbi:MAG: TonB family protein [Pseudomonadota bacterium]